MHILSLWSSFTFCSVYVHLELQWHINIATRTKQHVNNEITLKTMNVEQNRLFPAFHEHFPDFL